MERPAAPPASPAEAAAKTAAETTAQSLDCEGLLCPLPVLRTRKILQSLAPGQLLCVTTSDRMALIDLPHFCHEAGHDYLSAETSGSLTRHLIRRGG